MIFARPPRKIQRGGKTQSWTFSAHPCVLNSGRSFRRSLRLSKQPSSVPCSRLIVGWIDGLEYPPDRVRIVIACSCLQKDFPNPSGS